MSRTVYIEFTRSTKKFAPFSWLIMAVQRTPYSHVRLRWTNTTGRNVIYEASGSHVRFIGTLAQKSLKTKTVDTFTFEVDKEQYRKLVDICMYYADVKYSLSQVIKIGLLSFGICKRSLTNDGEYAQVCSELVARVVKSVLGLKLNLDPDTAGPKELHEELKRIL